MCIGRGDKNMRTNIVIEDKLMYQAMKLSGIKTKRAVVEEALLRLIKMEQKKELLKMAGKIEFRPHYNYKRLRKTRTGHMR